MEHWLDLWLVPFCSASPPSPPPHPTPLSLWSLLSPLSQSNMPPPPGLWPTPVAIATPACLPENMSCMLSGSQMLARCLSVLHSLLSRHTHTHTHRMKWLCRPEIVNMRVCFSASEAALITAPPHPWCVCLSMSGYSYMLNILSLNDFLPFMK